MKANMVYYRLRFSESQRHSGTNPAKTYESTPPPGGFVSINRLQVVGDSKESEPRERARKLPPARRRDAQKEPSIALRPSFVSRR